MKKMPHVFFVLLIISVIFSCTHHIQDTKEEWAILLHGGAGGGREMSFEKQVQYEHYLTQALRIGKILLAEGADAVDAVTQVVVYLENCPLFNAGKGAVITAEGFHELDAAIMDGRDLQAGAVAGVRDIKNPVKAARMVMEQSPHVLLIGEGASAFARSKGLEMVDNSWFSTQSRLEQIRKIRERKENPDPGGTVGCVALDKKGNLAAATSTGGMSGKQWGRVGDVPVIGAGTYADNGTVAVSGTGHGELWIRRCVGFDIHALMEYKNMSVQEAAHEVIFNKIDKMEGSGGGVICVDLNGNVAMEFNTDLMFRAWAKSSGDEGCGVFREPADKCPVALNRTYFLEKNNGYDQLNIKPGDLVFLGDDFMDRGMWNEMFGTEKIRNRGIATETSVGTLKRALEMKDLKATGVFLCTGYNDIQTGFSAPAEVAGRILAVVSSLEQLPLYVIGLPPAGDSCMQVNKRLEKTIARMKKAGRQVEYIPFPPLERGACYEGDNLNASGYCVLAKVLAPYLGLEMIARPVVTDYPERHPFYRHRVSLFHSLPVSEGQVIMLGNSLNNNCRWEELIPGKGVLNRGISGDVISGIEERLSEIIARKPVKLFLQTGTNDFLNNKDIAADSVWYEYRALIRHIRTALPKTELYVVSMTMLNPLTPLYEGQNEKMVRLNEFLESNRFTEGYRYIDLAAKLTDSQGNLADQYTYDGIHLSGEAYRIWREAIINFLE